jgi:glycosyltransferase involved in cell wall biosynthesis
MISAIILTWNSSHFIERCLQSLILDARSTGIDLEIFVVDGGSKDGTSEILARLSKEIPGLRLIFFGKK